MDIAEGLKQLIIDADFTIESIICLGYQELSEMLHIDLIGYLAISYGLFRGRGWAGSIALILSYIGIVIAIISILSGNFISVINLAINIAIVYFLYRPQVKAFFRKSPSAKI